MPQPDEPAPIDKKYAYLLETDPAAVAKANRRIQIPMFVTFATFVTLLCFIWRVDPPQGRPLPWSLVITFWIAGILLSLLAFRMRGLPKKNEVLIGADFLAASIPDGRAGFAVGKYDDVVAIYLALSKEQILGAGVRLKGFKVLSIQGVKDPALAVCAVFDHAPHHVKWRRLRFPYTRLPRDEVAALIARAGLPHLDRALPPGAAYGRKDEIFASPEGDFYLVAKDSQTSPRRLR
jgi:hypothetical protein